MNKKAPNTTTTTNNNNNTIGAAASSSVGDDNYKSSKLYPSVIATDRKPYVPARDDPNFNRIQYYSKITTSSIQQDHHRQQQQQQQEEEGVDISPTKALNTFNSTPSEYQFYDIFTPPAHILPPDLLSSYRRKGKVGSISAIFSIWNTMVGSTLLAIPWGFRQSGIVLGCIVFFIVGFISYYTCCLVVKHAKNLKELKRLFSKKNNVVVARVSLWQRFLAFFRSDGVRGARNTTRYSGEDQEETMSLLGSSGSSTNSSHKTNGGSKAVTTTAVSNRSMEDLFETDEEKAGGQEEAIADFADVCVLTLGKWSQILALVASVFILVGATIAYHIFMRDCLSSVVNGIANLQENEKFPWQKDGPAWYWNNIVASVAIILVVFPLSLFKDLTFLGKINSFGVFFVLGLLAFVIYSCTRAFIDPYWTLSQHSQNVTLAAASAIDQWNLDSIYGSLEWDDLWQTAIISSSQIFFGNGTTPHPPLINHLQLFSVEFSHLLAILSLSFFIHNVIVSILKNQKSLNHTGRDSGIAFILAGACYLIPGVLGAVAFRFVPTVEQNFLNQFSNRDIAANIARSAVLLQLMGIFPLLLYVIRVQLFGWLLNKPYPGFILTFILNLIVCLITTSFACFYPQVGTVLRYVGAICGLIYLFILPIGVHLSVLHKMNQLRWYSVIFHSGLVLFGICVLVLQFIPFEKLV